MAGLAAREVNRKRIPLHLCAEVLALRHSLVRNRALSFCYGRRNVGAMAGHEHEQLEISIMFHGAVCAYDCPWDSGRTERMFRGPAVLMIAPRQWHAWRCEKESDAINLYLERRLREELLPEGLETIAAAVPIISHDRMLWNLASSLRDPSLAQNPAQTKMLHLIAETLARRVVWLFRQGIPESLRKLPPDLERKVDALIQSKLAHDIFSEDLANCAGYSLPYFSTLLKGSKGVTPGEYLFQCRMEEADRLLRTGKYTIKQAGRMVGYWDQNNFAKRFTAFHHYTPKQAIQQGRAESSVRRNPS